MKTSPVIKTNMIFVISTPKKNITAILFVVLSGRDFPKFWVIDLISEATIWPINLKTGTVGLVSWRLTRCFFSARGTNARGPQPPPLVPSKDAQWHVSARIKNICTSFYSIRSKYDLTWGYKGFTSGAFFAYICIKWWYHFCLKLQGRLCLQHMLELAKQC